MAATPTTPAQAQKDYPTAQSFADFLNQHWKNKRITNPKSVGGVVLTGNNVGDQWLNWYATVLPNHPSYSLGDFEVTFFQIAVASSLGQAVAAAEGATGQFINQAQNALQTSNYAPQVGNPLAAIGAFFGGLTQANLWIRVAKVIAGGLILTVGLVKLTGFDAKAPGIVRSAVKVAPLL